MSLRGTVLLVMGLSCPFSALYACGSSPPAAPVPDASVPDTFVPDTSTLPDVGPFDSGGVFPCDQTTCTLGSAVCCFNGVGTGTCMSLADAGALPICPAPANEFDCAATGDCDSGVCCAQSGATSIWATCLSSCQAGGAVKAAAVLCNGPYDTTTCKGTKTCKGAVGTGYPAGYYFCN